MSSAELHQLNIGDTIYSGDRAITITEIYTN